MVHTQKHVHACAWCIFAQPNAHKPSRLMAITQESPNNKTTPREYHTKHAEDHVEIVLVISASCEASGAQQTCNFGSTEVQTGQQHTGCQPPDLQT